MNSVLKLGNTINRMAKKIWEDKEHISDVTRAPQNLRKPAS